jgi:hypothetical protein
VSAFAAEGAPLGPAHKIASKDIVVYDKDRRSGGIAKATVVEGLIAEALGSARCAVDVLYYDRRTRASRQRCLQGHGPGACSTSSTCWRAITTPRSAQASGCRQIIVGMVERLKANDIQEGATEGGPVAFAKDAVAFLECMHVCMLEETDRKKRHRWKKRFLDG